MGVVMDVDVVVGADVSSSKTSSSERAQAMVTANAVWRYLAVVSLVGSVSHSPSSVYLMTVSRGRSLSSYPPTIRKLLSYCTTGAYPILAGRLAVVA